MRGAALAIALASIGGCTGFQPIGEDAGEIPDGGEDLFSADANSDLDATSAADDAATDMTPAPPLDETCPGPWEAPSSVQAGCEQRKVFGLEVITQPSSLAIARTATGRIGVAWEYRLSFDESELHLAYFDEASPETATIVPVAHGMFARTGVALDLAGDADTLHLAYLMVDNSDNSVLYRALSPAGVLSTAEPIAGAFSATGETSIAVTPTEVHVAYYNSVVGNVATRARPTMQSGTWGLEESIATGLTAGVGVGDMDLRLGPNSVIELAYAKGVAPGITTPTFHHRGSGSWSGGYALDCQLSERCGMDLSLAHHQSEHFASYFKITNGPTATAEVRLVRWTQQVPTPPVTLLEQGIESSLSAPRHRTRMAIDRWGLVHYLIVEPLGGGPSHLYYTRETITPGSNARTFITDLVSDKIYSPGGETVLDLLIDDEGRPHIVFFEELTGRIVYATRFDR